MARVPIDRNAGFRADVPIGVCAIGVHFRRLGKRCRDDKGKDYSRLGVDLRGSVRSRVSV